MTDSNTKLPITPSGTDLEQTGEEEQPLLTSPDLRRSVLDGLNQVLYGSGLVCVQLGEPLVLLSFGFDLLCRRNLEIELSVDLPD